MADRVNFFFRQVVQEDEMDASNDALELADQDLVADLEQGQQASDTGVSVYDLTTFPTVSANNKQALLGGIHNGLSCAFSSAPSGGSPRPDAKVTVTAGTAHDDRGRRIVVGFKHDATTGRLINTNPSYIVDCTSAGVTPVGEGGSTSGGALAAPSSGQTRWFTLGVQYDRLLLEPRIDGSSATVFWKRTESFRFSVKLGAASSGTPTPPPPDPDVIILGDFLINSSNQIIGQDFKRRGDWIRTTIGATGDPTLVTTEDGNDPSHFVERNTRKAILRILRQTGSVSGDLAGHTNQTTPSLRHHAKNIDVSSTTATWANGYHHPVWSAGDTIRDPVLGGGTNEDGVQFFLNRMVQVLGSLDSPLGSTDGVAHIGTGAYVNPGTGPATAPLEWGGGHLGDLLYQMIAMINSAGLTGGLNLWQGQNFFTNTTIFNSDPIADNEPQVHHNVGSFDYPNKGMTDKFATSSSELANFHLEPGTNTTGAINRGPAFSICINCYWDNTALNWVAPDPTKTAFRVAFTPIGLLMSLRTDTSVTWQDTDTGTGWDKRMVFNFAGGGTSNRLLTVNPADTDGFIFKTNAPQTMAIGWDGFHPAGASGTIGGVLNYRVPYNFIPASIVVSSALTFNTNVTATPTFVQIEHDSAFWTVTPVATALHTRVHRVVVITP